MQQVTNKLRLYLEFEWDLKVGWEARGCGRPCHNEVA